ncbi:MAG: heme biosynthesis HemY N-terminal domain-containing protein [Pseudomonadota bacterium]
MIRFLIFFLGLLLFAGVVTFSMGLGGRIAIDAFGQKIDARADIFALALFLCFIATIFFTSVVKDLRRLPSFFRAKDKETKRERGATALTRGWEAVAAGDAQDATHHARIARRYLDDVSLTRLLTAQAAHMSGDDIGARENYAAMLEAPETEFLGQRGLFQQAMARGDREAARGHAERAFELRANAQWACEAVFNLNVERGAWGDARAALAKARKNKLMDVEKIDRAETVLLTADASALFHTDVKTALKEAEAALKLSPGFTPAAVLAARAHHDAGKTQKAIRVIEAAFAAAPHPALAAVFDDLIVDENDEKRAEKLALLADKAPQSKEAKLLYARNEILLGQWGEAIAKIEPLLSDHPTAEVFTLMARAFAGEHGEGAARGWLERAANAPLDPRPGADGVFRFTQHGWAQLVHEYMEHGRLAPPPLEDAETSLSREEVRLLTAPPVLIEDRSGASARKQGEERSDGSSGGESAETLEQTTLDKISGGAKPAPSVLDTDDAVTVDEDAAAAPEETLNEDTAATEVSGEETPTDTADDSEAAQGEDAIPHAEAEVINAPGAPLESQAGAGAANEAVVEEDASDEPIPEKETVSEEAKASEVDRDNQDKEETASAGTKAS